MAIKKHRLRKNTEDENDLDVPDTRADWLTVPEVAAKLGMSRSGLQRSINAGRFPVPSIILGKRRVFWRAVFDAYIQGLIEAGLKELKSRK